MINKFQIKMKVFCGNELAILLSDGTPLFLCKNMDEKSQVPNMWGMKAINISCGH